MAKIRRVVRRLNVAGRSFDEQLWPVYLALLVLGGYLIGVVLAFCTLSSPFWTNTVTWLIAVPLAIGGTMGLLAWLDSRRANRRMLLAVVISLLLNVIAASFSTQMVWYVYFQPALATGPKHENKERKVIPEYQHFQVEPRPQEKQDFQKPVEAKPPQPQPEQEQKPQDEAHQSQARPDVVEVAQPNEDATPNSVARQATDASAPRRSETPSKLSRQTTQFKPNTAPPAVALQSPTTPKSEASKIEAQTASVERQTASAKESTQPKPVEPTTTEKLEKVDFAKQQPTKEEVAQNTSSPTLPRNLNQPKAIPQTNAVAQEVTAPSAKETSPEQVKPNTTAAQKQETKSTVVAKPTTQPTPDTPTEIAQNQATRQQLSDRMQELATSAKPAPNRRTPTVTLPQTTTASAAEPTSVASNDSAQSEVRPSQSTAAQRSTSKPSTASAPQPSDAPDAPRPQEIAQNSNPRAQSSEVPTANPQATPVKSPSRNAAQPAPSVTDVAKAVQAPSAQPSETTTALTPAGTRVSKQQASTPSAARVAAQVADQPPTQVNEIASASQSRQQSAQPSPTLAQTPSPVLNRTSRVNSAPQASAIAASANTPNQSPAQANSPSLAPSSSTVARSASQAAAAQSSAQPMETPTTSPTAELARAQTSRAVTAEVPTINPSSAPTSSPARSSRASDLAASPESKAAPAASVSERVTSDPSADPGRLAVTKGFGGVAGAGTSANMDRAAPAPDSPAAEASGSARRAESTQQSETGPALSPSSPARIARSRAGASAPSSTHVAAREVENATIAGAAQAAELNASASAAIKHEASNAPQGDVTAARGEIDVDLGANKVISENAINGKASGGGQPTLNFETRSHKLARRDVGGAPDSRLASVEKAELAQAPAGDGGGEPATVEPSPESTSVVRTEAGGASPVTGGPAAAASDPAAEAAKAQLVADAKIGRAETIDAAQGAPATGGGSGSPSRKSTASQLQQDLLASAAEPADASNPPMGTPNGAAPAPSEAQVAREDASGGAPTSGGPAKAEDIGPAAEEQGSAASEQLAQAESSMGKAASIDSIEGRPSAGGGTASPTRRSSGPAFAADTQAEAVELAGTPNSSGTPDGSPIEAQGAEASKTAAGVSGKAASEIGGALASASVVDAPPSGGPGESPGTHRASPAAVDGPQVGGGDKSGGPLKLAANFAPPAGGAAEEVALADVGGGAPQGQPDLEAMMSGMDNAEMSRQASGGLPVDVSAPEGPGGLGEELALNAGTLSRQAQNESQEVHFREARFIRTRTGGPLSINVAADQGAQAFSGRSKTRNSELSSEEGGGAPSPTEKTVELGLQFLVNHQASDGSWSLGNFGAGRRGYEREKTALQSDTAATGLCLLAFLGGGYHHQDGRYEEVVQSAINYLVKHQKEDGNLYVEQDTESSRSVWLYSHAIATLALCEAYGMTLDPDLRAPAQKAVDFIATSQEKNLGGWRYAPGVSSDTSVTGWMMMALKSAQMARLDVPAETFEKINKWLDASQGSGDNRHLYVYNPLASTDVRVVTDKDGTRRQISQGHGREVSKTMTSVGLLMRLYSGRKKDDPHMIAGARYLAQNLPSNGTRQNPQRDTYYWYYASQVMFHMGGDFWEQWNERMHPLLKESQIQTGPMAGSWDPVGPIPDRWGGVPLTKDGPPMAGRIYVTTLNLLTLEVYHRLLPLYDDSVK